MLKLRVAAIFHLLCFSIVTYSNGEYYLNNNKTNVDHQADQSRASISAISQATEGGREIDNDTRYLSVDLCEYTYNVKAVAH